MRRKAIENQRERTTASVVIAAISKDQWSQFLDEFSRRHHGWLVHIEGDQTDVPPPKPQSGTTLPPLEAITVQSAGKDPAISVVVRHEGTRPAHTLYSIPGPFSLRAEEHDNGKEKSLVIGSQNGRTTVIRLHQVIRPPTRPPAV